MKSEGGRRRPRRSATSDDGPQRVYEGLGVSGGVAIGPAHVSESGVLAVPEYEIEPAAVAAEQARFAEAVQRARKQLIKLKGRLAHRPSAAAEELGYLLDAHLQMLTGSRLVRGVEGRIARQRINAEAAVQAEIGEIAQGFARIEDSYLAGRAKDVREVGDRVIRHLTKSPYLAFSMLPEGSIVLAEELSPADTALLDPARVGGFATELGGAESHTAIMARSLGLPAVLGVTGLTRHVRPGQTVIVDGDEGRVIVSPSRDCLATYTRRLRQIVRERSQLDRMRALPSITRDQVPVTLLVNLELPRDIARADAAGAAGVGLLRTEFLFMNRDDLPDEDAQYEQLASMVAAMAGRPVTIRTLDLGGDKIARALGDRWGGSANPALGLRAIRLGLREPGLLEAQLAAILRASAHGTVRILLPMISSVDEVLAVRAVMARVVQRLKRRGARMADPLPPLGTMIEVPGAALAADALARVSDFFALGTNDLTMYTLAIDRGDEQVAGLYNPLHPAVLRLIQFTVQAALRAQIPVSVCGEIAGDPRFTGLLVGLGVRELSMTASKISRVKKQVRAMQALAAAQRAAAIMDESDILRIAALLDGFNARLA